MIVVVEGLPGSGKTAICNDVVLRMSNVCLVPEMTAKYIKDTRYNQGWQREKFYMQNDERKCALAGKRNLSGFDVIMDRNYVATLAYNYAVTKTKIANTFTGVWQWFCRSRKLTVPNKYIYLEIPYKVGMQRKGRIHYEEEPWSNEKVLREMQRFYEDEFLNRIDKNVPKLVVDADRPYKEVLEQVTKVCYG